MAEPLTNRERDFRLWCELANWADDDRDAPHVEAFFAGWDAGFETKCVRLTEQNEALIKRVGEHNTRVEKALIAQGLAECEVARYRTTLEESVGLVLWAAALDRVPIEERVEWVAEMSERVARIVAVRHRTSSQLGR